MRESDAAGFAELAHLGQRRALQLDRQRADRIHVRLVERARAVFQHFDESGLVERRIGIGRAREAGDAAGDRRVHLRFQRRLVFETGLAQACGNIDEPGRDDETAGVDDALGVPSVRRRADRRHLARGDVERSDAVDPVGGIDQAAVGDLDFHKSHRRRRGAEKTRFFLGVSAPHCETSSQFPAIMLITAMRTAMPNVTCGRMTERSPSATAESISTPRFIGPGCMTITSGFASASFSCVRP